MVIGKPGPGCSELLMFLGDISGKVKLKDCAADCVSGSMNVGRGKTSFACCNTDRCNVQDAPGIVLYWPYAKKLCIYGQHSFYLEIRKYKWYNTECSLPVVNWLHGAGNSVISLDVKNTTCFCPVDPSNVPNGKKCYSCDDKSCLNILSCSGGEDRCFKASGENLDMEKIFYLSDVWDHLQVSNYRLTLVFSLFIRDHRWPVNSHKRLCLHIYLWCWKFG